MKKEQDTITIINSAVILVLAALLAILMAYLVPQETLIQAIILFVSTFIFSVTIFVFTFKTLSAKIIERYKQKKELFYIHLAVVLVVPLISLTFNEDFLSGLFAFVLWYLLPIALMIIPVMFTQWSDYKIFLHIPAVLIMAIGFDTRKTYAVTNGLQDVGYNFNALWVSTILLLVLSIQIENWQEKFNFELNTKKILLVLGLLAIIFAIVVPIGLATGFLAWNPQWMGIDVFLGSFIGIFFTIALPEELITRGAIQHQLLQKYGEKEGKNLKHAVNWLIIITVSLLFGASHWNNTSERFVWVYIGLASIAGIIYSMGFIFGGLVTAMLIHTLVDWIWSILFKA